MEQLKRVEAPAKFPLSQISILIAKLLVIDIFQTEVSLNKSLTKSFAIKYEISNWATVTKLLSFLIVTQTVEFPPASSWDRLPCVQVFLVLTQ